VKWPDWAKLASGMPCAPQAGPIGHIDTALLMASAPELQNLERAHICGPPGMMEAVKSTLIELGMPAERIRTEAFGTVKRDPTAKNAAG
jgi:ferredoxin-NADP reductase